MKNVFVQYYDKSDRLNLKNSEYASQLKDLFQWMIKADHTACDISSGIFFSKDKNSQLTADITAQQDCVVAGLEEIKYLLDSQTNLHLSVETVDGIIAKQNGLLGRITGPTGDVLAYERTILNILQRMSGIATITNSIISQNNLSNIHTPENKHKPYIAATRKTDWMWLDKKAVFVGGGLTHRLSLADEILIKDNHLDLLMSADQKDRQTIIDTVFKCLEKRNGRLAIIEVDSRFEALDYVSRLVSSGMKALILMLDNFSAQDAGQTIRQARKILKHQDKEVFFELSGGINENNIKTYAECGANVISLGSLTHSASAVDISMEIV